MTSPLSHWSSLGLVVLHYLLQMHVVPMPATQMGFRIACVPPAERWGERGACLCSVSVPVALYSCWMLIIQAKLCSVASQRDAVMLSVAFVRSTADVLASSRLIKNVEVLASSRLINNAEVLASSRTPLMFGPVVHQPSHW